MPSPIGAPEPIPVYPAVGEEAEKFKRRILEVLLK
jgi:hypothetical protein